MTTNSNLELVQDLYEAFARGDIEQVVSAFDDDIEWIEAEGGPYGGRYHGPDEVVSNVFMPLGEEWTEFTINLDRFVDGGDTIVALATYEGTYEQTGRSFEAPVAHVWDLDGGKVTRFHQYVDTVLHRKPLEA